MLLSLVLFFYQFIINDIVRCSEEEITLLNNYNEKSTYISLEGKVLVSLPSNISNFKNLKNLYLKYNQLNEIPVFLSQIKTLKLLDMDKNMLKKFPNEVRLKNLKDLYLGHNNISFTKPSSDKYDIIDLNKIFPKLTVLDLSHNHIEYMPSLQSASLERLYLRGNIITSIHPKTFIELKKLDFLILTRNNLTEINNDLGELTQLERLYISGNKIKTFILEKDCLENLKSLDLNSNKIEKFKLKQSTVPQITILSLTHNELSTISSDICNLISLEELSLSFNNITKIPNLISKLTNLRILNLYKNKISKIPKSIGRLTKLETFTINFEYLEKLYLPDCVIDIIIDKSTNLTYREYMDMDSQTSETVEDSSRHGHR